MARLPRIVHIAHPTASKQIQTLPPQENSPPSPAPSLLPGSSLLISTTVNLDSTAVKNLGHRTAAPPPDTRPTIPRGSSSLLAHQTKPIILYLILGWGNRELDSVLIWKIQFHSPPFLFPITSRNNATPTKATIFRNFFTLKCCLK